MSFSLFFRGALSSKRLSCATPLAVEIPQHYSCFLVAMPVSPDYIEAFRRRGDDVPTVWVGVNSFTDALLP